ncbi:hypothetical protein EJ04DRAFT_559056 [Polyplosphaeria fusca]|uniref:PinX1-related protein 1 n=1 Tax=Polyplosphaeria fusca TaxID=682080 RepID=A0A9P4V5D8_9PLEO|nr:hypothetical protein EJ04DRAFT_559056 [Polyplosphaeria fusca]
MGLAAPKNRSRIANDPQNTTWANNTSRFGHRILTSQGWQPGSALGAKDAKHAAHYSAASHSHIRVLLKEDNLGLGAKIGSERAENFGLAGLANVLGRLNGREEEVKKEEEWQAEVARRAKLVHRVGYMNFVSGGFLVGGDIVSKDEINAKAKTEVKVEIKEEDTEDRHVLQIEEKKTKKRRRVKVEDESVKEEEDDEQPKLKRKKKSMDLRAAAAEQDEQTDKSKREKKKRDKKSKKSSSSETDSAATEVPLSDKAARKAEKRARKEQKKLKKALKKAAKEAARSKSAPDSAAASSSSEDDEDGETPGTSAPTTGTATPVTSAGLTFGAGGRHAARARFIRSKKMASMDPQALKEILMIQTPS